MKKYELESFLKSFFIFLTLLEILLLINFYYEYKVKSVDLEESIHTKMKLCAYKIECDDFIVDFVDKTDDKEVNILYKVGKLYSYFNLSEDKTSLMKIIYKEDKYKSKLEALKLRITHKFYFYTLISVIISLLFSIYTLMPIKRALELNEEFIKDILHDFNTPLSSMRINLKILEKEIGNNNKIIRLNNNIQSILSLQNNLQFFLKNIPSQNNAFELKSLIQERIQFFQVLYPDLNYIIKIESTKLYTNKDAFIRIIDNILSNASKYNKEHGSIEITLDTYHLSIKDTGKGIKHTSKIFTRYYKEQERGIGIGLNIVKKLCEELSIQLRIKSKLKKGTQVYLNIQNIIVTP